ncbi:MAG TPA: MBL fold metallo-hydrolase [Dehalococcoidia bacterium]|nr:MBL fold metallo-hydrolase [Dehalococcoidia bacterium]
MKITIVYDNESGRPELKADHGYACLIESEDFPSILFDTGASGRILKHNLVELAKDFTDIGTVVISHRHSDHTGGLKSVIERNNDVDVYLPESYTTGVSARRVTRVGRPVQIHPGVVSTGELSGIEQSLVLTTGKGLVVVVGCAHPGLDNILRVASGFGKVWGIIGGFHGYRDFFELDYLSLVCPCHCTIYKAEIQRIFGKRCLNGKVGTVIKL